MSGEIHPSLAELINDEHRKYSKEQIAALVRELQSEGNNTRSILKALLDVTMEVCVELPNGNQHYNFLEYVRDQAQYGIQLFDAIIEKDKNTQQ